MVVNDPETLAEVEGIDRERAQVIVEAAIPHVEEVKKLEAEAAALEALAALAGHIRSELQAEQSAMESESDATRRPLGPAAGLRGLVFFRAWARLEELISQRYRG